MTETAAEELFNAFEEDHRILTQGLSEVLRLVRNKDLAGAARVADDLDRGAGPHITFEEEVFYPTLEKKLGGDFVAQLLEEHDAGRDALEKLRGVGDDATPDEATRIEIQKGLEKALEHALSCGTLLSHIEALEPEELGAMTASVRALRERGIRWTDRPAPVPAHS